jgi:hypothetical protein
LHHPGLLIIEIELHQPFQLHAEAWVEHRHHSLHPAIQVAWHPIGTAQKEFGCAGIGKSEQA